MGENQATGQVVPTEDAPFADRPGGLPEDECMLQGLALTKLPYDRLRLMPRVVSGLWLADNQLSHCPNLLQELLENFPNLSKVDLVGNQLTCDHLRLQSNETEMMERRRSERHLLQSLTMVGSWAEQEDSHDGGEVEEGYECLQSRHSVTSCTKEHHNHLQDNKKQAISCFFCSLQVCHLDQNCLTALPAELFTCLPNLRWLAVQRNLLTSIPKEIGKAKHLEGLRLDHNQLKELPEEMSQLQGLLCFSVSHNDLRSLPEELAELGSLETLMVQGNPNLLTLPERLVGRLSNLVEFVVDAPPPPPPVPQGHLGMVCRAESLLHISAGFVFKTWSGGIVNLNIPEELKELLMFKGKRCSKCRGTFFGDCVAELVWESKICEQAVLLRGQYCSHKCLIDAHPPLTATEKRREEEEEEEPGD